MVTVSDAESEEVFKNGAEKFYNEARLIAKFNGNPNIVSVHDIFYENDTVYFTMGFLKGQTLKEYLNQHGTLSPEQALCVANDISNALMAAHSLNVLHRDISPDNIMVCADGTIKLIDFGAARQLLAEGSQSLSVILKQGFAPLEQYQKKGKQGPWTDIYSLGATLYYALTMETLDDPMSRMEDDEEYSSNTHGINEDPDPNLTMPYREEIHGVGSRAMPQEKKSSTNNIEGFWNKKRVGISAGLVALLLILLVVKGGSNSRNSDVEEGSADDTEIATETIVETTYANYVNDTVKYSIDYPEDYQIMEAADNNQVNISDNDDFLFSVKYSYTTVGWSAIYSALDFANQVKLKPEVLSDWLLA